MMYVGIQGPEHAGNPGIVMRASGGYSPDVFNDLKARAIEAYWECFGEIAETTAQEEVTE